MKIIVDELPYDTNDCPFNHADSWGYELCPCRTDKNRCPMYWTSEHKRECERLIEYDEFMGKTGRKSQG